VGEEPRFGVQGDGVGSDPLEEDGGAERVVKELGKRLDGPEASPGDAEGGSKGVPKKQRIDSGSD